MKSKYKSADISVGDKFLYIVQKYPADWYAIEIIEIIRVSRETRFYFKVIDASGIYAETIREVNWWHKSVFKLLKRYYGNIWLRLENELRAQHVIQAQ